MFTRSNDRSGCPSHAHGWESFLKDRWIPSTDARNMGSTMDCIHKDIVHSTYDNV